ncbi:MAG: tryptophanase [Calditrichaeota bacterium]|nr:tryptophanase [Calditrichota bacterium]RQW04672.1 MAG: tryptophanase [Calditrichota bacterium]
MKLPLEPFRIKMVEPLKIISREEREALIKTAGYNVFKIPAEKVFIDLLTDSGTSAMSDAQWAGLMQGDESYAGCRNYYNLQETVEEITGYPYVLPTHQGRAAENILFSTLLDKNSVVPSNIHFDTTRANIEYLGATALDCVVDEGLDAEIEHPFKGNMDPLKLKAAISTYGTERIPLVCLTITNNSGGGQPVSMDNIREIKEICHTHSIPFFLDAARFAENAYFIKLRNEKYKDISVPQLVREMFSYADGCWVSAKKDAMVNIGGFIALQDKMLFEKLQNLLILREGFPTYGGLAGRDLQVMAIGLKEVLNEDYLAYRLEQVAFLGNLLLEAGIPIVKPVGGHAVYINAKKFCSHLPQSQFPAQALTVALYLEAGIRAVEIGSLMFAYRDNGSGKWHYPELELVRLAIPRRVYTASHLKYVADAIITLYQNRNQLKGLKLVNDPPFLRHFTAVLEKLD